MPANKKLLLLIIIFAQFAGTSVWFAGNAIIDQISSSGDHAAITSVVQLGFIAGTLVFSFLTIADRFNSSNVFFISCTLAAVANLLIIWWGKEEVNLSILRFITGFFLAGIYPVGMKIAADIFPEKLGKALGFLVGALVLGTAFPHFVRSQLEGINWKLVLVATSALAFIGGGMILTQIPPKRKYTSLSKPDLLAAFRVFQSKPFRSAAFGYFGHMWELYAFWSVLPIVFAYHNTLKNEEHNIYLWSFFIIATGAAGCVLGGLLSQRFGSKPVAYFSLLFSGICCLLAPLVFSKSSFLFHSLFLVWGLTVTADSPQFSALVAKNADEKVKGTALTIVTSIGFAITIVSILLLKNIFNTYKENGLWLLALGPLLGLLALKRPN